MEELLLDVTNAIWAAERINSLNPENPVVLPATEEAFTATILEITGQDIIGDLAQSQLFEDITFKEQALLLVDQAFESGVDSQEFANKRAAVVETLTHYPKLFVEE